MVSIVAHNGHQWILASAERVWIAKLENCFNSSRQDSRTLRLDVLREVSSSEFKPAPIANLSEPARGC